MQWEYKIVHLLDFLGTGEHEESLNELGKAGWEAFAFDQGILLLKRPLKNSAVDFCLSPEKFGAEGLGG